ncbi:MAG: hypothetical protein V2A79_06315 [Planctomycetota bacterium]
MNADELQDRVCRCCDRKYRYPVPKSLATRFYCEACSRLSEEARAMFELFNKRLRKLSADVEKLGRKPAERDKA